MTLTIHQGYDASYVYVAGTYEGRKLEWRCESVDIYRELANISSFVNNELGEEALFEID